MKKINVGVVFGGISAEHEVSIKSAISIIQNINLNKYLLTPIYIDIRGNWNFIDLLKNSNKTSLIPHIQKSINYIKSQSKTNNKTSHVINCDKLKQLIDVFFPIVHGKTGEDGTMQGFFELLDIPYVNSNILSSSMTMDKELTKILLKEKGIQVAPYISIKEYQYDNKKKDLMDHIKKNFSYPLFVKPSNCGSSIGITKVIDSNGLEKSIINAFKYDNKILIEQGIDAKEIEISVLENIEDYDQPIVSMPGRLIPNDEFYSYKAKYIMKDGAEFELPAKLDEDLSGSIREQAKEIFKILECNCLARIDFFLENNTNKLFFNEINTLPGFTEISLYPKLLGYYGIKYTDLIDKLIALSLKKHKHNNIKNKNSIKILDSIKLF